MAGQAWLGSRGLLIAVGLLVGITTGRSFHDLAANWDVQHFLLIAREGYGANSNEMAFFWGWPLLLWLGSLTGADPVLVGMLLSVVASVAAAAALVRMGGPWAAIGWLFAPTAIFTLVPYTEAAFCAMAFWAWQKASADRWPIAAVLAAAACTLRVSGLFLVVALAVMVLTWPGLSMRERLERWAWLLLPLAFLGGYVLYLYSLTGSWTAWFDAQAAGWPRGFHLPWESAEHTWQVMIGAGSYGEHPDWVWVFRAEAIAMLVGVVVTCWCLVKRLWAEAVWVGLQVVAFSTSYWWFSVNRAVLLWFPLWIALAALVESRPTGRISRPLRQLVLTLWGLCSVVAMLIWAWLFSTGQWAS